MPDCVLSNQNRFYTALEAAYGEAPTVTPSDRISAFDLRVEQSRELRRRRDKTGGRTFTGISPGSRKVTEFGLATYLVENATPATPPAVGPLVQAGLGSAPLIFTGGTAGAGSTTLQVVFSAPHGMAQGQAFGFAGELRFAESIDSATAVTVNAPLENAPQVGESLTAAVTYTPAEVLPSLSVFDYWDPATTVQRIVTGASVDRFRVLVNADYHELRFQGPAQDVIDSVTFVPGEGALASFPAEPSPLSDQPPPIPGNLGQAWLGTPLTKFFTVTSAAIEVDNDIDLRNREFGTTTPQCLAAGVRTVSADLELFEVDDEATRGLYAAARQELGMGVMFQLGQTAGRLMGVYLPTVKPEVPRFDDSDRILKWRFGGARAEGQSNDEVFVAFG